MTDRNGTFITIEGLDGAGKTTLVESLDKQYDIETTSEPSEFWTGEQLRRSLRADMPAFVDFFLFMADRHHHIEHLIKPAVEKGEIVVSDRFADSTRVYQPEQLKSDMMDPAYWIENVMEPWNYPPDIVVYVQISVDTALERADKEEKYENQKMLTAVKQNYEALVAEQIEADDGPEYIVVDGEQPKSDMVKEAVTALDVRLNE